MSVTETPRGVRRGERFDHRIRTAMIRRGAFPLLAFSTIALALSAGMLARLIASDDFDTYGDGAWWALVTLTTVGYGDIVPQSVAGRLIGAFVMVMGVTFLSFLTATVTSLFVSEDDSETRAALHRIEEHLAAIEARLNEQS